LFVFLHLLSMHVTVEFQKFLLAELFDLQLKANMVILSKLTFDFFFAELFFKQIAFLLQTFSQVYFLI
jgi:hypothetical protein